MRNGLASFTYVSIFRKMDDINKKIETLQAKVDAVYVSVEKTRRYFQWTLIATVVTVLLPLLGIIILIPHYLRMIGQLGSF